MAIGRISGPMLYNNLDRQGVDLSIDANLVYFDVNNRWVGINTTAPGYALDSTGNARIANIFVLGNTISSNSGGLSMGSATTFTNTTDSSGPTTGAVTVAGGMGIVRDLRVGGTIHANTIVSDNFQVLSIGESLVYLSPSSTTPYNYDIGLYSAFTGGSSNNYQHTGVVRNDADNYWYFFSNAAEPTGATVDLANANVVMDTIRAGGITLSNATVSSSSSTGAVVVTGGVGVGGNVTVSGNVVAPNFLFANGVNIFTAIAAGSYGNANVATYLPNYTGNIASGNTTVTGNFYGNILTDQISPRTGNIVTFNSSAAIKLPVGDTATRPTGASGYLRFNTALGTVEYHNGTAWVPLTNTITDQQITPDGVAQTFTLTQSTTAAGILVSINGTMQQPDIAYTVSGTSLTFTEVPLTTDIVNVRYIATVSTVVSTDSTLVDSANVALGTVLKIIDSFDTTAYRSAKYTISSSNSSDAQFSELMLIQNAGSVAISNVANVRVGVSAVTYTANVSGTTVNLLAQATTASNQLRIQRTYFVI